MNLIFTHLPPKPGASSDIYAGRHIVSASFIDALLKYGTHHRIIVYTPISYRDTYLNYRSGYLIPGKIELLDAESIQRSISIEEPAVIQTLVTSLKEGIHLRFLCGSRPWPVIGLTHDLSSVEVYTDLLLTHIGKPTSYDAIVSTTKCAYRVLKRLIDTSSAAIGCISQLQLPIIPLGIDLASFDKQSSIATEFNPRAINNKPIFLYLGRLSYTMKADLLPLIASFKEVQHKYPSSLILAGSVFSPDEETVARIQNYIAELHLTNHVAIYTNITTRTRLELLSMADVLVIPSDSFQESFGLVLLEAMAMRLPIIASDWNGYREVIEEQKNGFLIETIMPEDELEDVSKRLLFENRWWWYGEFAQSVVVNQTQLQNTMLSLLKDSTLRKKMGTAGRERTKKYFEWSHVIYLYQNEWERLTNIAHHAPPPNPTSPYWYDRSQVFIDHPTKFFNSNSKVRLIEHNFSNKFEISFPPPFLSSDTLTEVIKLIKNEIFIRDVPLPQPERNRYIAYLLKHGYIELINE